MARAGRRARPVARRSALSGLAACLLLAPVRPVAGARCGDHAWVHWYAVARLDAAVAFFRTIEGYRPGPRAWRASPWAKGAAPPPRYASADLCPLSADDRLVRLIEVPAPRREGANTRPGTLTLRTAAYGATLAAARRHFGVTPRTGSRGGARALWFDDSFGNTFIVLEAAPGAR